MPQVVEICSLRLRHHRTRHPSVLLCIIEIPPCAAGVPGKPATRLREPLSSFAQVHAWDRNLGVSTEHHAVRESNKNNRQDNEDGRFDTLERPEPAGRLKGDPLVPPMGGKARRGDPLPTNAPTRHVAGNWSRLIPLP